MSKELQYGLGYCDSCKHWAGWDDGHGTHNGGTEARCKALPQLKVYIGEEGVDDWGHRNARLDGYAIAETYQCNQCGLWALNPDKPWEE